MTAHKSLDDMTEPELSKLFDFVAHLLVAVLPPDTEFIVLASPSAEQGRRCISQYVANCTNESALTWMREAAEQLDKRQFVERSGA